MDNLKLIEQVLKIKQDLKKLIENKNDVYSLFIHTNNFFLESQDDLSKKKDFLFIYKHSENFYNKLNVLVHSLISLSNINLNNKEQQSALLNYQDIFNQILNNLNELKISSEDVNNKSISVNSSEYEYLSGLIKNINHFFITVIQNDELLNLINQIENDLIKKDKIKIYKTVSGLNSNVLYHGVNLNIMVDILKRGSILGYTSHRYWDEGRRYKESDSKYRESYWMKGISMTRDLSYALDWRPFIFIFNKDVIEKKHKVQLYNWFAHGERVPKNKNEREEFIVLSKTNKTFLNKDNFEYMKEYNECSEYYNKMDDNDPEKVEYKSFLDKLKKGQMNYDLNAMGKPEGELLIDESLVGIVIDSEAMAYYDSYEDDFNFVINHPKFLGYVKR